MEGRRFAFATLWSLSKGLSCGHLQIDHLPRMVADFKSHLDDQMEIGAKSVISDFADSEIVASTSLSINSKNGTVIPAHQNSSFFIFDVKIASQNKGVARQMDTAKFTWSIRQMILNVVNHTPKVVDIIFQLDNARYHRELVDSSLRNIVDVYPRKKSNGTFSQSMISKLAEWNFKPSWAASDWFQVKQATLGKLSKNKSDAERSAILKEREEINKHKNTVRKYFRMAPQYRHAETVVERLCEQLSVEFDRNISVLWGARGHSELAEIEFSWNFIKRFTKQMNPLNAKETTGLIKVAEILDVVNSQSWRNQILINIYCYIRNGYFTQKLRKSEAKEFTTINLYFEQLFQKISSSYSYSVPGFHQFRDFFEKNIVKQLSFSEIQQYI